MTSAPGAFLSIRAGGPLDGAVAISAPDAPGRLLVEASWTVDGDRRMASETRDDFEAVDQQDADGPELDPRGGLRVRARPA